MSEGKKFLQEQVAAAERRRAQAVEQLNDALVRFETSTHDLEAYQKALEAYTRGTDSPYYAPQLDNPLEGYFKMLSGSQVEPRVAGLSIPPPRITKTGVIYDAMAQQNGNGLKVREILNIIPRDAPIPISIDDLYRALPRLQRQGKVWRDKKGRYRIGRQSEHPLSDEILFREDTVGEDTEKLTAS